MGRVKQFGFIGLMSMRLRVAGEEIVKVYEGWILFFFFSFMVDFLCRIEGFDLFLQVLQSYGRVLGSGGSILGER